MREVKSDGGAMEQFKAIYVVSGYRYIGISGLEVGVICVMRFPPTIKYPITFCDFNSCGYFVQI